MAETRSNEEQLKLQQNISESAAGPAFSAAPATKSAAAELSTGSTEAEAAFAEVAAPAKEPVQIVSLKSLQSSSASTRDDRGPTTPQKLVLFVILIWLLAGSFGFTGLVGADRLHDAAANFGQRVFPSTLTAQEIRADLLDLNTNAVDVFLTLSEQRRQLSLDQYDKSEAKVTDLLLSAATDDPEDLSTIKSLINGVQKYLRRAEAARTYFELHSDRSWQALLDEIHCMRYEVLPLSDKLVQTRHDRVERSFAASISNIELLLHVAVISGVLLIVTLMSAQIYLRKKVRRILNVWLAFATVCGIGIVSVFYLASENCLKSVMVANAKAYDKINMLWQMRSAANEANGLESLYLLSKQDQNQFEREFNGPQNFVSVNTNRLDALENSNLASTADSSGAANSAARQMLQSWSEYIKIDSEIRRLEQSNNHNAAVELCLGAAPNQSEHAFASFSQALIQMTDQNRELLADATARGVAEMRFLGSACMTIAIMIAFLTWLGIRPRLREYRSDVPS